MANESLVSSMAADLREQIIQDAYFVAQDQGLMEALVTPINNYSGMEARAMGKYAQFTAQTVAEGAEIGTNSEFAKTDLGDLTPAIVQVEGVLTDERVLTDYQNAGRDFAFNMGLAIAKKVDTDLAGNFASATNSVGTAGSAVSISKIAAAMAILSNNSTPNPVNAVWHPYHWHAIWTELGQPASNQAMLGDTANQALRDYYRAGQDLGGAMHFVSANIGTAGGTAFSGVFHSSGIVLDERTPLEIETEREAKKRSTIYAAHRRYAHGIWKSEHVVSVLGTVVTPS